MPRHRATASIADNDTVQLACCPYSWWLASLAPATTSAPQSQSCGARKSHLHCYKTPKQSNSASHLELVHCYSNGRAESSARRRWRTPRQRRAPRPDDGGALLDDGEVHGPTTVTRSPADARRWPWIPGCSIRRRRLESNEWRLR